MDAPEGCSSSDVGITNWEAGMTFADFAEITTSRLLLPECSAYLCC